MAVNLFNLRTPSIQNPRPREHWDYLGRLRIGWTGSGGCRWRHCDLGEWLEIPSDCRAKGVDAVKKLERDGHLHDPFAIFFRIVVQRPINEHSDIEARVVGFNQGLPILSAYDDRFIPAIHPVVQAA